MVSTGILRQVQRAEAPGLYKTSNLKTNDESNFAYAA